MKKTMKQRTFSKSGYQKKKNLPKKSPRGIASQTIFSSNSSFSKKVYSVVAKIPKGKTMTYKEVATKAGNPLAARAVGMLMSKNYNPKIPCHRVVRSDGAPSGYNRGGWHHKQELLKEEGWK